MNLSPRRSCFGKRKYARRMDAVATLNLRRDQAHQWPHRYARYIANDYQHSTVYECFWCGNFHIGRMPRELRASPNHIQPNTGDTIPNHLNQ